jgi:hypothetical protein
VASIFNLVDACDRSSAVFRLACERLDSDKAEFRSLADATSQILDRFRYELQTEIRRMDGAEFGPTPVCIENDEDLEVLLNLCEVSLQTALEQYRVTLNTALTAHARAMLKRQVLEILQAYERLLQLRTPA